MNARLNRLLVLARTLPRLGLGNIAVVALYRLSIKTGLAARLTPDRVSPSGDLLAGNALASAPVGIDAETLKQRGEDILSGQLGWFGNHVFDVGSPPDWFRNPFKNTSASGQDRHWSKIPDFDRELGDIKSIWEPSRFDWFCDLVRAARATGDQRYIAGANVWARDWMARNQPYRGHNWKCGQETSLRLMAVLHGAWLAGEIDRPTPTLLAFASIHLERIRPSMAYAEAQDNNHGTSEAAALWVAGRFLAKHGDAAEQRLGADCAALGRKKLIGRIRHLVMPDGSFSQHSVNYHRLFLDTMSLASVLLEAIDGGSNPFFAMPADVIERLKAAVHWLQAMAGSERDMPLIGANDGAWLLQTAASSYGDLRPHLAIAGERLAGIALFRESQSLTAWSPGPAAALLPPPELQKVVLFPDGGYAVLRAGSWKVILRLPRYRFRPSHADALHVDIWHNGQCLVTDSGTWSYLEPSPDGDLAQTAAHATLVIDDRSQMPRLGRFLFGDWLNGSFERLPEAHGTGIKAGYRDRAGASHERTVLVAEHGVTITDVAKGARRKIALRWPLCSENWQGNASGAQSPGYHLHVQGSGSVAHRTKPGFRSTGYLHGTPLVAHLFEIEAGDASLTTLIEATAQKFS